MTDAPAHWAGLPLDRPLVMGILNVTPDSFSDGGKHGTPDAAIAAGCAMLAAGVDIIDVGGESTRPNAAFVPPALEIARVRPVIEALAREGAVISADTRHAATMEAALTAGARIINDVSGLKHDPHAAALVAQAGCPVVLMHMRGAPETMDTHTHYENLLEDVLAELTATRDAALKAGIRAEHIALDPGFGFAKTGAQNLRLLRATRRFAALGHPVLIGLSRKRFIGEAGQEPEAAKRFPGSLAAGLYAISQGAHLLRVHDVAETVQALRVWERLVAIDDDPHS
ncbi:MAG TPA: dihydropteroate synthase [Acidocella sp.]|jgi:dihydropteroate synthase|nr:dihydropteroate synthase [Acidocella sp.]